MTDQKDQDRLAEPYRMTTGKDDVTAFRDCEIWTNVPNETEWYAAEDYRLLAAENERLKSALRQASDFYDNAGSSERFAEGVDIDAVRSALRAAPIAERKNT